MQLISKPFGPNSDTVKRMSCEGTQTLLVLSAGRLDWLPPTTIYLVRRKRAIESEYGLRIAETRAEGNGRAREEKKLPLEWWEPQPIICVLGAQFHAWSANSFVCRTIAVETGLNRIIDC